MRGVAPWAADAPAGPRIVELPEPVPREGEVLLEVRAAALNRADLLQVRGRYPPPPGASPIPGLEVAGVLRNAPAGSAASRSFDWEPGARAMALLGGGGQAERVAVPVGQLLPIPPNISFREAAAVPEVGVTAWTNLVVEGGLRPGEWLAIAGAASGVGTFAVQVARELGARTIVLGRRPNRLEPLRDLGAEAIVPLGDDLVEEIRSATGGRGADLVLDLVGGAWTPKLLAGLAPHGRLVLVGLLAGQRAEVDLGPILRNQLRIRGSLLRPRPEAEKAELVRGFGEFALPRLADGRLRAIVDRVLPFDQVADAYAALERSEALGKIVLEL